MARYTGCRVVVACEDGTSLEDDDADLQLGDGRLLLSYWDDEGAVVLAGAEDGAGGFDLLARSRPRRGTLRREGARVFGGTWSQGALRGTLRVELPVSSDDEEEER